METLMNERITELMIDAGKTIPGEKHIDADFCNKFAELIVQECMEVFSKDLPEPGDGKMMEVINRVCAVAEHFGVEE
jgi:predicted house-cleaning noncanonical NTP pyrophosphatase (MazG superfamily)